MDRSELQEWLDANNSDLYLNSNSAKKIILREAKKRRDVRRYIIVREKSFTQFGLKKGRYISWGYGSNSEEYDEYFGEINTFHQPHGIGIKYYCDGSIYFGKFQNGLPYTSEDGILTKLNGFIYEGGWVAGKMHGYGKLTYPDIVLLKESYEGQFANGYEHGQGILHYTDKSIHKGRFRFGLRDGPGIFTIPLGHVHRGNFKDKPTEVYIEPSIPIVYEDDLPTFNKHNPLSLIELTTRAISIYVVSIPRKNAVQPQQLQMQINKLTNEHKSLLANFHIVQQLLAEGFYRALHDIGTAELKQKLTTKFQLCLCTGSYIFDMAEKVHFNGTRMSEADIEALTFFQGGNLALSSLSLIGSGLRPNSTINLSKCMRQWKQLTSLDLSYNIIKNVDLILTGCSQNIKLLRLKGCGITNSHITSFARIFGGVDQEGFQYSLEELDLSFNKIGTDGALQISEFIKLPNFRLKCLFLRSTDIWQTGAEYIAEAMKGNSVLEIVNIADNNVRASTIVEIASRLIGSYHEFNKSFLPDEVNLPKRYVIGNHEI